MRTGEVEATLVYRMPHHGVEKLHNERTQLPNACLLAPLIHDPSSETVWAGLIQYSRSLAPWEESPVPNHPLASHAPYDVRW